MYELTVQRTFSAAHHLRDYEGPCGDGSCPGMIRGRCMFVGGKPVRAAEGMFVEGRCR